MKQLSVLKKMSVVVLIMLMAGSALAQREWAPGLEKRKGPGREGGTSSIWLSFGPSLGKWNPLGEIFELDYGGETMVGVGVEMAIRPIKSSSGAKLRWALEVPLVATLHQKEFTLHGFMISTQLIPTARLIAETKSGLVFSPYFGLGGGVVVHIAEGGSNILDAVFSIRMGSDVMFTKVFGVRLNHTRSSVKYKSDVEIWDWETGQSRPVDESVSFNQFNVGIVYHP